jgi:hypothetical protein
MQRNKQSARSLVAFRVTWAFVLLTVPGIVLYIVPQGRVACWIHWSLLGLKKEQWAGEDNIRQLAERHGETPTC